MRSLGNCRAWSVKGRGSQVEGAKGRGLKSRIEDRKVEGRKVERQKFRPMSRVEKLNSLRIHSNLEWNVVKTTFKKTRLSSIKELRFGSINTKY